MGKGAKDVDIVSNSTESRSARERVEDELKELSEKSRKLSKFIGTESFYALSDEQQALLCLQSNTMCSYELILQRRLKIW